MKPKKKLFFMECHVAGRQYYEASDVWDRLTLGTRLRLELDEANYYDHDAVAVIYYDAQQEEEYQLGYIPRTENATLAKFLRMGWEDIFECFISRLDAEEHYEQQIHVVIRIRKKEQDQ